MARFEEIVPGILRLKVPFGAGWTAVTLIRGEENCLIDAAGCAANVDDTIVPALKAEGLRMDDIACVLLTHMHGDHVGGVARMKELNPALKAAVFRDSLERMREPRVYSRKIRSVYPAYSAPVPEVLEGCEPDILLGDGEGWGPLALIHTPGHDTDSCCWWHIPTGTLICGDSLQQRGMLYRLARTRFSSLRAIREAARRRRSIPKILACFLPCARSRESRRLRLWRGRR